MEVRQARPIDAPLVVALTTDEGAHLIGHRGRLLSKEIGQTLWRVMMPLSLGGRCWVARDRRELALLEAQPRPYVLSWDITRLAARTARDEVIEAVTGCAVRHMQELGIPRLFARCAEEHSGYLTRLGFQPLTREFTLVGAHSLVSTQRPLDESRFRMPADAWPLHQLESDITPASIRQLEGQSSVDWSARSRNMSELVVEREGSLVGWIGWTVDEAHRSGMIRLMVHPAHRDVARLLLAHVLARAPAHSRFTARVREYHSETLRAFLDAGFEIVGEDVVLLKTASVEMVQPVRTRLKTAAIPGLPAFHAQDVLLPSDRAPFSAPWTGT